MGELEWPAPHQLACIPGSPADLNRPYRIASHWWSCHCISPDRARFIKEQLERRPVTV
jgi:hypothetical protein